MKDRWKCLRSEERLPTLESVCMIKTYGVAHMSMGPPGHWLKATRTGAACGHSKGSTVLLEFEVKVFCCQLIFLARSIGHKGVVPRWPSLGSFEQNLFLARAKFQIRLEARALANGLKFYIRWLQSSLKGEIILKLMILFWRFSLFWTMIYVITIVPWCKHWSGGQSEPLDTAIRYFCNATLLISALRFQATQLPPYPIPVMLVVKVAWCYPHPPYPSVVLVILSPVLLVCMITWVIQDVGQTGKCGEWLLFLCFCAWHYESFLFERSETSKKKTFRRWALLFLPQKCIWHAEYANNVAVTFWEQTGTWYN